MGKLEDILAQGVKDQKIPHAVLFATNGDGSWTYKHTVGKHVHGSPDSDNIGEDAEFMLASSTKLLTVIVALQAVDKGLIGLDDTVDDKIPELAKQGVFKGFDGDKAIVEERKNPLTLRLLLTHSSGCAYDFIASDLLKYNQQRDPTYVPNAAKTVAGRFSYPLIFEPGTSWCYGPGIDWAGKVIERLTGKPLDTLVQEGIARPLGLHSITFFPWGKAELEAKIPPRTARLPDGTFTLPTEPFINDDPVDGMGGHGAYATAGDYLAVLRSLLANDGRLLTPETAETLFTPQLTPQATEAQREVMQGPVAAFFIGEWTPDMDVNWSLGGILVMKDGEGRRKKGTVAWGGAQNTFWMIDREADLAISWATQVLPPGDKGVEEMITAVELDLYEKKGVKF